MTGKNNSVQGLRGLFAIGVLLSHCSFTRGYPIWKWIMPLSNVGFFFMLSGYFMFLTYKDTEITKFLKKKLIRLYPLHICMTLLMVLVKLASHTFEFTFGNLLTVTAHLLLLQTWIPSISVATAYNTVSWFLSSLLFCFIVGFWLVRWRKSTHPAGAKLAARLLTAGLLALKVVAAVIHPDDNATGFYMTYLCPLAALPDFLIGFEIAEIFGRIKMEERARSICQSAAVFAMIIMFSTKHFLPVNYTRAFYSIPFNIFFIAAFTKETKLSAAVFGNRAMCFLGAISFEVYLIHDILITACSKYIPVIPRLCALSPVPAVVFVIFASAICAIVYQKLYKAFLGRLSKAREE